MSVPQLSVVLPIRNRSGVRLDNCLRALRWQQDVSNDDVEIIISDFGSEPAHRDAVQQAARTYGAQVHYTAAGGLWNRSRALNIGVKRANGRYTMCTDVDMVFAPTFLRVLLDTQEELGGRGLLLCQSRDLEPGTEGHRIDVGDLGALYESAKVRPTYGMGGCQCADTQWFHHVRGYDQGFTYWGAEDKDLVLRAGRDGRVIKWVTEQTYMLHQWHPTAKYDKRWVVKKNRFRLKMTSWIVRKNWLGWGA